jgi:hypothetical protein
MRAEFGRTRAMRNLAAKETYPMSEARQDQTRTIQFDDDNWTVEGEQNRAMHALKEAKDALLNLFMMWEDPKTDIVDNLIGDVEQVIDELNETIN